MAETDIACECKCTAILTSRCDPTLWLAHCGACLWKSTGAQPWSSYLESTVKLIHASPQWNVGLGAMPGTCVTLPYN